MMANGEIYLKVISPENTVVDKMVSSVTLPGKAGRFTVLKDHAPLISSLSKGEIRYSDGEYSDNSLEISGGFVEVSGNKVIVCVEM
ncbi:MAG: ATP synthase F1 subunit epsilon [Bacteroidales bacterium]|nr:ATP synthase F1 subunit epsilon [Bacteroidales bacterium]